MFCFLFPEKTDFLKIFLCNFVFRSENQILKKNIIIEIEISDFFEINAFMCESKEDDHFGFNLKYQKIIMSGELEQEMVGICKKGGNIKFLL